jgi:hypothetical protein
MGMVGGGGNATIGVIHKMAAELDGEIELVAGTFSSNAERSRRSGETLGLHPSRVYSDYPTMATEEAKLSKYSRVARVGSGASERAHRQISERFTKDTTAWQ